MKPKMSNTRFSGYVKPQHGRILQKDFTLNALQNQNHHEIDN